MDANLLRTFFDQTVNGLVVGNIYALLAVGVALIFGVAHLINFAQGSTFMAGAFTGWFLMTRLHWPVAIALPMVALVSAGIGIVVEQVGVRPFQKNARVAPLLATLGLGIIMDQLVQIIFGPYTQAFSSPFPTERLRLAGISVGWLDIFIALLSFTSTMVLFIFLKCTKIGQAIRASAQDSEAAQQMGVDVNLTNRIAFGIASALGGLGGVLVGMYYNNLSPTMGFQAGLKGFTACILGGLGSIPGAVAGGLILGIIESWGVGFFGSTYRNLFAFSLLVLVLFIRPNGIFNRGKFPVQEPLTSTFIPNAKSIRIPPVGIAGLSIIAVILPLFPVNPYLIQIFTNVWTYSILAVSLTLVAGTVGMISLGHAGLLALGAYASALFTMRLGLPFELSILAAGFFTAVVGTIFVLPAFKLKGHYVAIATIGVGEIINQLILNWEELTGGAFGISNIAPPSFLGIPLTTPAAYYWLTLGFLSLSAGFISRITNTSFGRVLRSLREDETAARSFGIRPGHYKMLAYAASGFVAGIGGALTAHMYSYINNETFNSSLSIMGLTAVILGGVGNVAGAIAGTLVLTVIPESLRGIAEWRWLFYGVVLIATLRFRPQGILGSR